MLGRLAAMISVVVEVVLRNGSAPTAIDMRNFLGRIQQIRVSEDFSVSSTNCLSLIKPTTRVQLGRECELLADVHSPVRRRLPERVSKSLGAEPIVSGFPISRNARRDPQLLFRRRSRQRWSTSHADHARSSFALSHWRSLHPASHPGQ